MLRLDVWRSTGRDPFSHLGLRNFGAHQVCHQCAPLRPVERGDFIEAEAFAYLAVRSRLGLPLSVPGTTGVPKPMTGGKFHEPE